MGHDFMAFTVHVFGHGMQASRFLYVCTHRCIEVCINVYIYIYVCVYKPKGQASTYTSYKHDRLVRAIL